MNDKTKGRILTALLLSAAFGWGISVFGVFMPFQWAADQLQGLGAQGHLTPQGA